MTHAVQATFAQAAAEGIDRQFAFQGNASVLDKAIGFALSAEARRFQPVQRGGAESVV